MQVGNASGEIRHRVLQGQRTPEGVSPDKFYVPGIRVSAKKKYAAIRADMDPLSAISASALKRIGQEIREWNLPRQTSVSLNELARRYNHQIRGWMNYYSHFYNS